MTNRLKTSGFFPLNATIALLIVCVCASPRSYLLSFVHQPSLTKVTLVDALFGCFFLFTWNFCITRLQMGGSITRKENSILPVLLQVTCLLIFTSVFFAVFHKALFRFHTLALIFCALALYELLRTTIKLSLRTRLAARDPRRAIIIGSGRRAGKAWREVRLKYHSSVTLLGFVDDRDVSAMSPDIANRYLGSIHDLNALLLKDVVDLVLIAMPTKSCYDLIQKAVDVAQSVGAEVVYLDDVYATSIRKNDAEDGVFRELAPKADSFVAALFWKRLADIVLSITGLILLSPVFLAIALGVALTSKGGVIFQQERFGYRRRLFTIFKFRSMVQGAEAMLPSLEHANEVDGHLFKMRDDPRVTKLGRVLRRTSLDELPQLWNVLLGDMSLVGPRPMSIRDVSLFSDSTLMRRFSVRPGMTGLWQVTGRSETTFTELIRLDHSYIDQWSLGLDLRILCKTVAVVFSRSGAM